MSLGLSLGTNDTHLIPFLRTLIKEKRIQHIEIYARPDVTIEEIEKWQKLKINYIVHAPHNEKAEFSTRYLEIGKMVADYLKAKKVVFDAGTDSHIDVFTMGALPENMPYFTSFGDRGAFCEPSEVGGDFCFDVAHAWMTAAYLKEKPREYLDKFIAKKPKHYHVANTSDLNRDNHCALFEGVVDMEYVASIIPKRATVTIEVDHEALDRKTRMKIDLFQFRQLWQNKKQ